jgi:hypothetical protein
VNTRRHFIATLSAALGASAFAAEGKTKTIFLKSGWDTVNIGDIGHTPGTLHIIEQHLPEAHVVLWLASRTPEIEAMLRRRFPKLELLIGFLDEENARGATLRGAFARADVCLFNSGMGYDPIFMEYCRSIGKPYGLYGQSFFPSFFEGKDAAKKRELLSAAAFVFCRDNHTLETLRKGGVKTPVLEFGPDGCFGIDVRDDERGLATMRQLGLEERKFITLQLRTHSAKHEGKDGGPLNPLNPTPQQIGDDERRAGVYRELITLWVKKTGHKVLLAPEVKKEMAHNRRLIFDPLPAEIQKHVVNLETFWNADEAASVFARAHSVVCHEPHSPIIALANGTPIMHTFSEFHGPKCWMFQDIGLGEWLPEFDSTPAAKMAEILFAIDADYPAALAKVKQAMDFVHSRQADTMKAVSKVLTS